MCEALNIKVAIMKRFWENLHYDMVSMPPMISDLLGVDTSYDVMRYACLTGKDEIIRDIANELPIAIELDNLQLNWD